MTLPLTVSASASAESPEASMAPLTVRAARRTPAGTFTTNSTVTSLFFEFIRPLSPARHSLGRAESVLG